MPGPRAICLFADASPQREGEAVTGFSGVAYSGGVVPNFGWRGDIAIDLSSMQLPAEKVPVVFAHDDGDIRETVGYAAVQNDGRALRITEGRFSKVTEAGRLAAGLMAEGQPFMFSVGINSKSRDADRSKATDLNGQALRVDAVLHDARLLEISLVHSGADPKAIAARLSARMGITPTTESNQMTPEEIVAMQSRLAALEAQVSTLTSERDAARSELKTLRESERNTRIVALFGEKHGLTDAQLGVYRGMTDEQFAATRDALVAARGGADPALFQQQATQGRDEGGASPSTFSAPAGYGVDPAQAQLHAKALAYQRAHAGTDYFTAVMAAQQGA